MTRTLKYLNIGFAHKLLAFVIVLAAVILLLTAFILFSGFDPLEVYANLIMGSFGSRGAIGQTLIRTSPILLASLGLIIAFRCGVWNIGPEGQLYLGALGAALVGIYVSVPSYLHIPLAVLASFIMGGAWAGIAGVLKTRFDANEVIVTLLSNFIAIFLTYYVLRFHLQPPNVYNPVSDFIKPTAELPILIEGTLIHFGICIALISAIIVWFLMNRTVLGYSIDAVGVNKIAAFSGGIRVNQVILISMFLSGGFAGLAGLGEVLGVQHVLIIGISPNYGYMAIAVVFIARHNPISAILVSLFFGAILAGGQHLQRTLQVPSVLVQMLVGLLIIFALIQSVVERKMSRKQVLRQEAE